MTPLVSWLDGDSNAGGTFGFGLMLLLWLFLPLIIGAFALFGWWHRDALRRAFGAALYQKVLPTSVRVRRTLRDVLAVSGVFFGILALSEPRCGKDVERVTERGVDMVIAVDLSRSMDAEDVDPSRLERARREIFDLIELLEGDRVGLVIYAGGAYPRMPLTADHDALRLLAGELSTDTFEAQGSEIGEAIAASQQLLLADHGSKAGKAILLLSDGEAHDPGAALDAARKAADAGIRIYTMGIGEEASRIPDHLRGTYLRDDDGQIVMTQPNPDLLQELARVGRGAYVHSGPGSADMAQLYRTEIRGGVKAGEATVRQKVTWKSAHMLPLALAVLCGLLAAWIGEGRRAFGAAAAGLLVAAMLGTALPAKASTVADGDAAYRNATYREAVRIFTELAREHPDDDDVLRRLAAARYKAGDYEGAAQAYDQAAEVEHHADPETLFAAGTAHHQAGRLDTAKERYDEVLQRNPDHEGAAHNLDVLQQELEARREQQPKPPPQQDPKQGGQSDKSNAQDSHDQQQDHEGSSQDQQSPSSDQQQDGQQGDKGKQGQQENKEGQSGQGNPNGDSEDSQQTGAQKTQQAGGHKEPGEGQERTDDTQSPTADPNAQDGQTTAAGEPPEGEKADGTYTAAQAKRLLEGVEEGRPRVRVPGGASDKPW